MANRISLKDAASEPYRFFFPQGLMAGLFGVALWPMYFLHATESYPGVVHVRIMAYGFFGGFIFGFLGTAMPRMLSAKPFGVRETFSLLVLHATMVVVYASGKIAWGDSILLLLLAFFGSCVVRRAADRKDTPPPGFVLVGMAFLCVISGAILAIVQNYREIAPFWINLQRLLSSQGFVLLPILGIGPFILPRFFGMESSHDFPESLAPGLVWKRKAFLALTVGLVVVGSFFIEAWAFYRIAYGVRFLATLIYLFLEFPLHRAPKWTNTFGFALRIAFLLLIAGFFAVMLFPQFRVALLHLTLVGGFAVVTFVVATRVVFGHSGNLEKLKQRNSWFVVALSLMLFAMATRVSGDLWPKIMVSHYIYGALFWAIGVLLWSWRVLPKLFHAQ